MPIMPTKTAQGKKDNFYMHFCQVPLNLAEDFLKYTLCNMPYWLLRYSTMTQEA